MLCQEIFLVTYDYKTIWKIDKLTNSHIRKQETGNPYWYLGDRKRCHHKADVTLCPQFDTVSLPSFAICQNHATNSLCVGYAKFLVGPVKHYPFSKILVAKIKGFVCNARYASFNTCQKQMESRKGKFNYYSQLLI